MSNLDKDMRDSYGEALLEVGEENERVILLDADVAHPTRAHHFGKQFPDRFIQLGVTEQNAISFAAGLSTTGFVPIVNMFGCFLARRACDQIAVHVAYSDSNVKLAASYAGITSPNTGATHQSIQDISIMRSMPNMIVVEPADGLELKQALRAIIEYEGPVYFRFCRGDVGGGPPPVSPPDYKFEIGKGVLLRDGSDITLIGSGLMTSRCIEAAQELSDEGISAQVINISTLKPIDEELIIEVAQHSGAIVTAENHSVIGGLGSAVAEVLVENCPIPMRRVGVQDVFGESGDLRDLHEKYGLTASKVVVAAKETLSRI